MLTLHTSFTLVKGVREIGMNEPARRRDRVRAATLREISDTARRLLVDHGPEGASVRAIAREMHMTPPALYRYFASHEELLRHVVADVLTDLCDDLERTIAALGEPDAAAAMPVAARGFRQWAVAHPAEFRLAFGTPGMDVSPVHTDPASAANRRFAGMFHDLFVELWQSRGFPVPDPADLDPVLRAQLEEHRNLTGDPLPTGALLVFLECWGRLYGMVTLEVFGHLAFALPDIEPMFERTLTELAADLDCD